MQTIVANAHIYITAPQHLPTFVILFLSSFTMISLQKPNKMLSKKRKWDDDDDTHDHDPVEDQISLNSKKLQVANPVFNSNFHSFQAQSPLDWQRCLDIKSGQIYFYNTRTNKRASSNDDDSVRSSLKNNQAPMSLELELNLPCQSLEHDSGTTSICSNDHFTSSGTIEGSGGHVLTRPPSWLTFEAEEQHEMVTAVCRKCYMLVMMCKSSRLCPNCKFVHPLEESMMSNLFNQQVDR